MSHTVIDQSELPLADHIDERLFENAQSPGAAGAASWIGPLGFARKSSSSIVGRDAAPWVTDFLDAAYYRKGAAERAIDDLRLAFCVLTTYWDRKPQHHRLRLTDLRAFHRAYGHDYFATHHVPRCTLDRAQLLDDAASLLGPWFPEAYADDDRRGWGIAFETVQARDAYDPAHRMALADLGSLTPESASSADQLWCSYPPVEMPSAQAAISALTTPADWPDFATEVGRLTPLRAGGLDGQTFEIEMEVEAAGETGAVRPMFTSGYLTVTKLVTPSDPAELAAWFVALAGGPRSGHENATRALPEDVQPLFGLELTPHHGHFMGNGHNRLLLYTRRGQAWLRAAGTWDPTPRRLENGYPRQARNAQHAFWGQGGIDTQSMLHQLARQIAV